MDKQSTIFAKVLTTFESLGWTLLGLPYVAKVIMLLDQRPFTKASSAVVLWMLFFLGEVIVLLSSVVGDTGNKLSFSYLVRSTIAVLAALVFGFVALVLYWALTADDAMTTSCYKRFCS